MNYIKSILLSIFTLLLVISCDQLGDDFKLPGENPKDIIYFELDNNYLAPESKEFIETNFSSNNVNFSYVLIGKKTYGFEADLDNQMSLSFDEDGNYKLDRDHPFLKDNYKKGKFNNSDSDKREDKDKEEGKGEDKDRNDKDREHKDLRCFEYVMPFSLMMPDSSVIIIEKDSDKEMVDLWFRNNSQTEKKPRVILPVSVSIIDEEGDEKVIEITKEEEIRELISSCSNIGEKDKERCFEIVMPFSFSMPDSSIIVIEEEEDHKKIEEWYKNNSDTSFFSMKRPKLVFPVDIIITNKKDDGKEELVSKTVNSEDGMKKISINCTGKDGKKDKKDRSKKLKGDEVPECIIEFITSNYPEDKILHSRMLKTKSSEIFYIVKLENKGILKFDEDCDLLD